MRRFTNFKFPPFFLEKKCGVSWGLSNIEFASQTGLVDSLCVFLS